MIFRWGSCGWIYAGVAAEGLAAFRESLRPEKSGITHSYINLKILTIIYSENLPTIFY